MASETKEKPQKSRRGLLLGVGALAGVAWGWQRFGVGTPSITFNDIEGLSGWRFATIGEVFASGNASNAVFLGIGAADQPDPLPSADLEAALFSDISGDPPIAMFHDVYCPYCAVLASRLISMGAPVQWHELPLLHPASEPAARAAIAAGLQGGYDAFQTQLKSAPFQPSAGYITRLARNAGLDPDKLLADMDIAPVTSRLSTSERAAATLGIYGTPGLAIGKTVVVGNPSFEVLDTLIADERSR